MMGSAKVLRVAGLFCCTASFSACSARWQSYLAEVIAKLRLNSKVATLPLIAWPEGVGEICRDSIAISWLTVTKHKR
jgi:hypothetical protein